jgi:hypothetical protein
MVVLYIKAEDPALFNQHTVSIPSPHLWSRVEILVFKSDMLQIKTITLLLTAHSMIVALAVLHALSSLVLFPQKEEIDMTCNP